jgi:hypothetical protein
MAVFMNEVRGYQESIQLSGAMLQNKRAKEEETEGEALSLST